MSHIDRLPEPTDGLTGSEVAIIGMACEFPGAKDIEQFWENLANGVESIHSLTDQELEAMGQSPSTYNDPGYVRAVRSMENAEWFDAAFFGISPAEAEIIDPQQRKILQCTWHALEDAGYDPDTYGRPIALFGGGRTNFYLWNIFSRPEIGEAVGDFQAQVANNVDYLMTRVAYKLNLQGPAVTLQTACSTSLVAVHLGCQSLLSGECGLALAGGVALKAPQTGYIHKEGSIYSTDGHVRTFDAKASGTIFGHGMGMLALKRLEDALADGDNVRAVIKGSAVNNDGLLKVGFTAPAAEGQVRVIRAAQALAEVDPRTLSYVEAHGTGTQTGDPIEVSALTEAFRASTPDTGFCALGSVKTNIGHLGSAAGAAGLIKTCLMLEHRKLAPSLLFEEPNPEIDFASSPFFVNTELREWAASDGARRRAAVSSFGIGGTNAHAIVEEAPPAPATSPGRAHQLVMVSARGERSLEQATDLLASHFERHPELDLADVCFTLQMGRRPFELRRYAVVRDLGDAREVLAGRDPKRVRTGRKPGTERSVCFLFSGQGSQYPGMGRHLYEREAVFRDTVNRAAEVLEPLLGQDLRDILYPPTDGEAAAAALEQTRLSQPALLTIETAMARLWMSWGVVPQAMVGHSIGEYAAACLAGVLDFEDALALVAARGRLMQGLPTGSMLSVPLPEAEVAPMLDGQISIAAVNAPNRCVVSGPGEAVEALERRLAGDGVAVSRLHTSHAFHSPMMEPILQPFLDEVAKVVLRAPEIPYISNVTGTWITDDEATDPQYYALHIRRGVRFADGLEVLLGDPERILLETGPGKTLVQLAQRQPDKGSGHTLLTSLRHPQEQGVDDQAYALDTLGLLWLSGVSPDWRSFYAGEHRRRASLPGYPFDEHRYFIERNRDALGVDSHLKRSREMPDWFELPSWRPSVSPRLRLDEQRPRWLLFADDVLLHRQIEERLRKLGQEVAVVRPGEGWRPVGDRAFEVAPDSREDHEKLVQTLADRGLLPHQVLHLWSWTPRDADPTLEEIEGRSFYSLLRLAQSLGLRSTADPVRVAVVSDGAAALPLDRYHGGAPRPRPEKAILLGPCQVMSVEYAQLAARHVDVDLPADGGEDAAELIDRLIAETVAAQPGFSVAYRGGERWVRSYENISLDAAEPERLPLRFGGHYLITGGLGGFGLTFAELLAREHGARLTLVGRSELPERGSWEDYLAGCAEDDRLGRKLRKVRELEGLGAEVLTVSADISDAADLERVVALARDRFGGFDGVIHAAGVPGGGMMQLKTREMADAVLRPKLRGTLALERALSGESLGFLVLCSSVIAPIGSVGQVDYCAANSFLDAFAEARNRSAGSPYVSIEWPAWQQVGMAVDSASQIGSLATEGRATPPPGERSPSRTADAEPPSGTGAAEPETAAPSAPLECGPIHPLIDRAVEGENGAAVFSTAFDASRHWVLDEHRIMGRPALPGTTHLELARAAFAELTGGSESCEIRNVFFFQPLMTDEGTSREARVVLRPATGRDAFEFSVISRDGDGWMQHAQGVVGPLSGGRSERVVDLEAVRAEVPNSVALGTQTTDREGFVFWGPRWQVLQEVRTGDGVALARLTLPEEYAQDVDELVLHPALLDVATALTGGIAGGGSYLPFSYSGLRVSRRLPRSFYSLLRLRSGAEDAETVSAEISLLDPEGRELLSIEEFTMKRVGQARERFQAAPAGQTEEPKEEKSLYSGTGILPEEGVEVLRRILSRLRYPVVAVSKKDVTARRNKMIAAVQAAASRGKDERGAATSSRSRPDLPTPFVEPNTETERRLAEIWREVLGLEEVGTYDDFFQLGGDSVLSVRIVTRARELGLDIQPKQFFEAPTIAELAKALDEGEPADSEETPAAAPEREILVPLAGPVGAAAAAAAPGLFCFHAIDGDVHWYEEIARALGSERPVYGLTSAASQVDRRKGLDEMVETYVAEIRRIQEEPPYHLVGWSMGGVLAMEAARSFDQRGEAVYLALVDPPPPGIYAWSDLIDDAALLSLFAGDTSALSLANLTPEAWEVMRRIDPEQIRTLIEIIEASRSTVGRRRAEDPDPMSRRDQLISNFRALSTHESRPYGGPALFVAALDSEWRRFDEGERAWNRLLPRAEQVEVHGDHYSVLRSPVVEEVVGSLGAWFASRSAAEASHTPLSADGEAGLVELAQLRVPR